MLPALEACSCSPIEGFARDNYTSAPGALKRNGSRAPGRVSTCLCLGSPLPRARCSSRIYCLQASISPLAGCNLGFRRKSLHWPHCGAAARQAPFPGIYRGSRPGPVPIPARGLAGPLHNQEFGPAVQFPPRRDDRVFAGRVASPGELNQGRTRAGRRYGGAIVTSLPVIPRTRTPNPGPTPPVTGIPTVGGESPPI